MCIAGLVYLVNGKDRGEFFLKGYVDMGDSYSSSLPRKKNSTPSLKIFFFFSFEAFSFHEEKNTTSTRGFEFH